MAAQESDYIKDLLEKIHTTATAKSTSDVGNIASIDDTARLFVHPGEIVGTEQSLGIVVKWYDVEIYESTEILMMAAVNDIINGLNKMTARTAITSYTKPDILISGKFITTTKQWSNPKTTHWTCKIKLQFKWSTI